MTRIRSNSRPVQVRLCCRLLLALLLMPVLPWTHAFAEDGITYAAHIQPLLAKKCVVCHGPDTAESGLRLDLQLSATGIADSGSCAVSRASC